MCAGTAPSGTEWEKSSSRRSRSYGLTKEQETIRCSEHTSATAGPPRPAPGVCRGRDRRRAQPLLLCQATSSSLAGHRSQQQPEDGFTSAALKNSEKSGAPREGRLASSLPCPGVLLRAALLQLARAWCFFAGKLTKIPGLLPPWPKRGCAQSSPGLSRAPKGGNVATTSGHRFARASCPLLDHFLPYLISSLSPFSLLSNKSASL